MGKNKEKTTSKNKQEDTSVTEEKTSIEKAAPAAGALATELGENNELFMQTYGDAVARVDKELPSKRQLQMIMDKLPEDLLDNLSGILKKLSGVSKGVYVSEDRPELTELRLYHGTGNDPNRPEKMIPGEYYLTSKTNIGESFDCTVLAIWTGRTMWEEDNRGMPACQSMDRKYGSTFGVCEDCINKPWRGGQPQKCNNDVLALVLPKTMDDIVLVRFTKTSEPAGKRLAKFVKSSMSPWTKWYTITSKEKTGKEDKTRRWYVMEVEPVGGDDGYVPEELDEFCDAMCTMLESTIVLPGIARIYSQAQEAMAEMADPSGGSAGLMSGDESLADDMGDAPDNM